MPRAPTPDDVEQLRHVAQDGYGVPLSGEDLAFLGSEQQALVANDHGDLYVVGIAQVRFCPAHAVRAALADARAVWTLVHHGAP